MPAFFRKTVCFTILVKCIPLLLLPLCAPAQQRVWSGKDKYKKNKSAQVKSSVNDLASRGLSEEFRHTLLLGAKLNSDGWSGGLYYMKKRTPHISHLFQLTFSEIKHEKQVKQKSAGGGPLPPSPPPLPFVFGKINNLYTLQIGTGLEHLLLPAVMKGKLSVGMRHSLGFSLAMLKPYYLKLIYNENVNGVDTAHLEEHFYSTADSARFLNNNLIYGASSLTKGLDAIKPIPGAYFETAIVITPGTNKFLIQSITLGVNGSFYAAKLPIMAGQEAYMWQANLFAGLALGKRWK